MYLACIEIADCSQPRVVQVEFSALEPAKLWAVEEAAHRDDATGNAAVFETAGPLMTLAWERPLAESGSLPFDEDNSRPRLMRA